MESLVMDTGPAEKVTEVRIPVEEYREFQRQRNLILLAMRLARQVHLGLIGDTPLGVAIANNPAAAKAVELANELLATE